MDLAHTCAQNSLPLGPHPLAPRATSEPPNLGSPYCDSDFNYAGAHESYTTPASPEFTPFASFTSSFGSSDSLSSSMSRRRMASNIPALDSRICMPLTSSASEDRGLCRRTPGSFTSSLCDSLSDLSLLDISSVPKTPADQVIPEQHTPPEAPRQHNFKLKHKLSLPSLSSLQDPYYASYPFTPLEEGPGISPLWLPPNIKEDPLSGLETLLPRQYQLQPPSATPTLSQPCQVSSPSTASDIVLSGRSQPADRLRRRGLPVSTRRLSYNYTDMSPTLPSPFSGPVHRSPMLQHSEGLASPVILDASFPSISSPRVMEPSPLQRSVGFPASPGYFNIRE